MYLSKLKIFSHIHASVLIIGVWPLFTYHVFKPTKVYWSRYTFILLLTDYYIFSFFILIQGRKPFKFLQALPKIGYDLGLHWSTFQHNVRILMYEIFLGFLMLPNNLSFCIKSPDQCLTLVVLYGYSKLRSWLQICWHF